MTTTTTIDCDSCPVRGRFCGDCFVPVLGQLWLRPPSVRDEDEEPVPALSPAPGPTVRLDSDELAAVSAFVRAGLVTVQEADGARAQVTPTGYAAG